MDFIKADLDRLVVLEMEEPARAQAALTKISITTSLEEASRDSDVVLEEVYENLDLKQQIFRDLDAFCPDRTILANSISKIIPSRFAEVTRRPDRVLVSHYTGRPICLSWRRSSAPNRPPTRRWESFFRP